MGLNAASITIDIDELVLYDLPATHRRSIEEGLRRELLRLLEAGVTPELFARSTSIDALRSPDVAIVPQQPPERMGADIARAVYAAVTQTGEKQQ